MRLDHLMWGAPSLAQGMSEVERLFGVRPVFGGSHPGMGTCNALLGLGDACYLEVIAPDPGLSNPVRPGAAPESFGSRLAVLDTCALITWAVRSDDLKVLVKRYTEQDLKVRGPTAMQRETPEGERLQWELLFLGGHAFGNLLPFFIDWRDCVHPSVSLPVVGELEHLEIGAPDTKDLNLLRDLVTGTDPRVSVHATGVPKLTARVKVAGRIVSLTSSSATSELRM